MGVDVHVTSNASAFAAAAQSFLERDPVRNTVLLTVLAQWPMTDECWFAWACDGDAVTGAALRTPPFRIALAAMDPAAAAALGTRITDAPGAVGPADVVHAFAAGRAVDVTMREVQYVLTELEAPLAPPGRPRRYTDEDAATYVEWMATFVAETGVTHDSDPLRVLARRLATGGALWIWERDGEPVCMAGRTAAVGGVPRIGPVFTPSAHRGHGYAAALTAHICAEAFAAGADACTLFADAANPTSNGVYVRIGFRPVGEIVDATFTQAAVS